MTSGRSVLTIVGPDHSYHRLSLHRHTGLNRLLAHRRSRGRHRDRRCSCRRRTWCRLEMPCESKTEESNYRFGRREVGDQGIVEDDEFADEL